MIGNLDGGPTTLLQITKYVQPTRDGEFEQWRVTYADGTHEDMDSFEVCVHTGCVEILNLAFFMSYLVRCVCGLRGVP